MLEGLKASDSLWLRNTKECRGSEKGFATRIKGRVGFYAAIDETGEVSDLRFVVIFVGSTLHAGHKRIDKDHRRL